MPISKTDMLDIKSSNPFLSQDDKQALAKKKELYDKMLSTEGLAAYKLEVMFSKDFSVTKPCMGALSFWESGTKLHGGGDAVMHICPGKDKGVNNCDAFIPDVSHGFGFLVCQKCGCKWDGDEVSGQVLAKLTTANWAAVLTKYFLKLESKADIVIKYHPLDLRSAAAQEQEKVHMGDLLGNVRTKRAIRIYTLKSILTDTSGGSTIENRILSFIRA